MAVTGLKPRFAGRETTAAAVVSLLLLFNAQGAADEAGDAFWTAHVEPLLTAHCTECHSATKLKSGLDLTSLQTILRGGDRGAAVIPGRPEESHLYRSLLEGADPHMPPGTRKKLSEDEVALVRTWIEKLGASKPVTATNWSETEYVAVAPKPRFDWQPTADMPPSAAIDRFLELGWDLEKVQPAKVISDHRFVRRVYLDLIGRIPTRDETEQFLRDGSQDKRRQLVDTLLATDEYARHMREIFDPVLMERRGARWEERRENEKWFKWLEDSFRENRPWNETVRDMIVARPEDAEKRGAVWFIYERENNAQGVAEALAPVVFGVQVKCAQCHDHMVAREIKQAHYWGMVAAFNRSKNVDTPEGPAVAESAIGGFVSFANLKKESQPARLIFFNGSSVEEEWPKEGEKETDSPDLYRVPPAESEGKDEDKGRRRRQRAAKADHASVPKFSRREAFADAVTRENPLLARAMVNRVWAMLLGRGIVHPVDLMDSKHPPSQPELLNWLADDFARNGYDVKRLIRAVCHSRAYQLDSRPARPGKPPQPGTFARALEKPLTAEQLFRSLLVATGNQKDNNGMIAGKSETDVRRAFVKEFPELFPAEYNATLQQAMFFSNAPLVEDLLASRDGSVLSSIAAVPEVSSQVRDAFLWIFGREPDEAELRECASYLEQRSGERGVKQLLWAMLTSAEFQLNH